MDNEMIVANVGAVDEAAENKAVKQYKRNGVELEINPYLPFYEMMEMVNDVAGCCFNEDAGFLPELMDFAFRVNVLERYTNLMLPDDLNEKYEMVYGTDLVEFVLEHVHQNQLKAMIKAINRKIEYTCDANIEELRRRTNQIVEGLENVQKEVSEAFSGVKSGDIAKLAAAFASGDYGHVDEEKIVRALFGSGPAEKHSENTEA